MMHGPDLAGRGIVSIYGKMKASVVLSGKVVNNLQILGDLLPVRGLSDERAGVRAIRCVKVRRGVKAVQHQLSVDMAQPVDRAVMGAQHHLRHGDRIKV